MVGHSTVSLDFALIQTIDVMPRHDGPKGGASTAAGLLSLLSPPPPRVNRDYMCARRAHTRDATSRGDQTRECDAGRLG